MTESIFQFLAGIGFTHPLHPALTHLPMGLIMGAVVFRLISLIPRFKYFSRTGYHCIVLGLLGIFPTVFTGYLDWQHTFAGKWDFWIILKMVLAVALTGVLAAITFMDDAQNPKLDKVTIFYLLTIVIAIGLGFSGGELTLQLIHAS